MGERLAAEIIVEAHPLHPVLTSLPAVGVRTAAGILTEIVGKDFASAGLAPVTWRSGPAIRGDRPHRKGNKILKRALFLPAFAALKDPPSRAFYARKRAEGKRHNQPSSPRPPPLRHVCKGGYKAARGVNSRSDYE
jgi:transposase